MSKLNNDLLKASIAQVSTIITIHEAVTPVFKRKHAAPGELWLRARPCTFSCFKAVSYPFLPYTRIKHVLHFHLSVF